jgi:hypothetical protein
MTAHWKVKYSSAPPAREDTAASAPGDGSEVKKGLVFGLASGLAAITCCVSPVVFVLVGIATAAEAVSLGDTLYYTYGWVFRGAGLLLAIVAVVLYLRGRNSCSPRGVFRYRRMLAFLVLSGAATYTGLFWFTKYLGIWFG